MTSELTAQGEGLARARAIALPLTTEERWRRSDPKDFDPFRWGDLAARVPEAADLSEFSDLVEAAHVVVVGRSGIRSIGRALADGLTVACGQDGELWESSVALFGSERFAAFHKAAAQHVVRVRVAAGIEIAHPLVIVHETGGAEPLVVTTLIELGTRSKLVVAEDWERSGEVEVLTAVHCGEGARVHQLVWAGGNDSGSGLWQHLVRLERNADYHGTLMFSGGKRTRLMTATELVGAHAASRLRGIVAAGGRQHFDIEPVQVHAASHSTSDMLFKTAATGKSRVVFQGDIVVMRPAKGCDANQTNKNLLLSPSARVDTLPKLNILPDDVKCRHGAATGSVDPELVYYLTARGFTRDEAVKAIVGGFFADVTADLPEGVLKEFYAKRLAVVAQRVTAAGNV